MKKLSITIISVLAAIVICFCYSENVLGNLSNSMIRLHVIANSDCEADQALKLRVRDRLLSEGQDIFLPSQSGEETLAVLNKNRGRLLRAAQDEVARAGYPYKVSIETGEFFFPAKKYENITLPAGNYEAVRVVIGEGKGKNWWCVMFPPLCFVDSSVGVADNTAQQTLKSKLSDSEYSLITENGKLPVDIRFKIIDFLQNSANGVKAALKK